jgi:hypothetical protein
MAMNAAVTSHQLVYLYSAAGGRRTAMLLALAEWWTVRRPEYYNRFSATSSGKVVFQTFGIPKPSCYEKRSSTAKGLLLGVFFSVEGPLDKNTFSKTVQRQV